MPNNNGKIHAVDVPVTDLDDPEEDVVFSERLTESNGTQSDPDNYSFDNLDYEFVDGLNKKKSWIGRIRSYLEPKHLKYELINTEEGGHPSRTGAMNENRDQVRSLRDYKIELIYDRIKRTVYTGIIVLFALVIIGFCISRKYKNFDAYAKQNNKEILSNSTHNFYPTTIVVSLDGFHPHYVSPYLTPTLHNMMLKNYGAPYMIPSFPSSTFPNHWTLVTGLYPSEHGIVGNTFYDPDLKKQFVNTNPKQGGLDPDFWQGGEPVWTTAFNQGINSAIHMWPGSEVPGIGIDGGGPLEVDRYNGSELLSSKVYRVMNWLDRENIEERPELILTYVPTIDQFGHKFGINGSSLQDALKYVDDFANLMLKELDSRNLSNVVNLIFVSDHGMAPTSNDRLIYLDDLIDLKKLEHVDGWPLFGLRPSATYSVDDIIEEVTKRFEMIDDDLKMHYKILKTEDMPPEWQFGGQKSDHKFNYRLAPIWIIPDVGYVITTKKQMKDNNYDYKPKGVHGYNNTELLMRALFLGKGPYFSAKLPDENSRRMIKPFRNTEVYNLICDTLNLEPSPNNGTSSAGKVSGLISASNLLPEGWYDNLVYPNLPFETDYIVNDATYDYLWKKINREKPTTIAISTNNHPFESLLLEASSLSSIQSQPVPKPTDLFGSETLETPETQDDNTMQEIWEDIDEKVENMESKLEHSLKNTIDKIDNWFDKILGNNDNAE